MLKPAVVSSLVTGASSPKTGVSSPTSRLGVGVGSGRGCCVGVIVNAGGVGVIIEDDEGGVIDGNGLGTIIGEGGANTINGDGWGVVTVDGNGVSGIVANAGTGTTVCKGRDDIDGVVGTSIVAGPGAAGECAIDG